MASIFKPLGNQDIVSTKTLLHEAIPITGSIISGSYSDNNVKNFTHGMFQSIYDYPYLSSSSNHIFDITVGVASTSQLSSSITNQRSKKANIYNQMAQVLMGYDKDGNIQKFDEDGDLTGGTKINDAVFVSFSRLLVKDEIKKETFSLKLGMNSASLDGVPANNPWHGSLVEVYDKSALTNYRVNSPVGEYGILYARSVSGYGSRVAVADTKCGLLFYQAGVAVLTSSLFMGSVQNGMLDATGDAEFGNNSGLSITGSILSDGISGSADGVRHRIYDVQFNNTIELNSTIHFCRVNHNEFNYSSNPTYLSGSEVRVIQDDSKDHAISYITSIGLYSADNQLLAVGKLSEPIRKDPSIELTFRARLDY
jgi:hypothetical protein